jgi:3-phosphoshikimate 1-carboxyvinyltransferase
MFGSVRGPSDKSLTHRAYMLGAIASGESRVANPLRGEDCESTLHCLRQMGLRDREENGERILIPAPEWKSPAGPLDCGNSGTTIRLMSGLVASRRIDAQMVGDASLSRRPMGRIAKPLKLMGAIFEGDTPPVHIRGGDLKAIRYETPVASAQVKSCILLAGLRAEGETVVREPSLSRDHTERMLRALGVPVISRGFGLADTEHRVAAIASDPSHEASLHAVDKLNPFSFSVPADISSAAFLMCAAAIIPGSRVRLLDVTVNPTRTGVLDVLEQCGVSVGLTNLREELGEPLADILIEGPKELRPFAIAGSLVPRLIDEIPVLAVLATQCDGESVIQDAGELRVKESDRIQVMVEGLRSMGGAAEPLTDGMVIKGRTELSAARIAARGDHRIAMSFAVAGLIASGSTEIEGAESIQTSFPDFEGLLGRLVTGSETDVE